MGYVRKKARFFTPEEVKERKRIRAKERYQRTHPKFIKMTPEERKIKARAYRQAHRAKRKAEKLFLKEAYEALSQPKKDRMDRCYLIRDFLGSDKFHVDHIIPISLGGEHHPDNIQVVPAKLNLQKNNNLEFIIGKHQRIRV